MRELGGIDILVNNAAIYPRRAWTEIAEEEWDEVFATNLKGYFLCARACYPSMAGAGRGRIINLTSITFFGGWSMLLSYVSTKGGIVAFTRGLARELGPEGITVNSISPGAFPTDAEKIHPDPEGYNAGCSSNSRSSGAARRRTSATSPSSSRATPRPSSPASCSRSTAAG